MTAQTKESSAEIRQLILDAAKARFSLYGYNKTTMAEIAKDCDMSASNIYRFFENKIEIAAHLTSECLGDMINRLQQAVSENGLSCEQRFRKFVHSMLEYTYEQLSEHPKINELVIAVCSESREIVKQFTQNKHHVIESLLSEAVQTGEFYVKDTATAAQAVLTATVLFDMPLLLSNYSVEEATIKADDLCDLLLDGLRTGK